MNEAVTIIGAGPAGLAVAGCLRQYQIDFNILEQAESVGSAWRAHYDRLHLHTVKALSHLPHLPFPEDYPQYVPRQKLVDYLEAYARHFHIQPHLGKAVRTIARKGSDWEAITDSGETFHAPHLVFATGVNRAPFQPKIAGMDQFQGNMIHSRSYRNALPYRNQRVLVIGMGNTGAEIALDLSENGAEAYISVRGPVNIVPRDVMGRPTQLTARMLGKLPHWLGDGIGVIVRKFTVGNLEPYGIQTPAMPPAKQLRETGKTPVIDVGTLTQIKAGRIKVVPEVANFTQQGAVFKDGTTRDFDSVIFATGYHPDLTDFLPEIAEITDQSGIPKEIIGTGKFSGLYFVGFDNYTPGGILGVINRDAPLVAAHIRDQILANS